MTSFKPCAVLCVTLCYCLPAETPADTFGEGSNEFTLDFVAIGIPGNPPDWTGVPKPAGSVSDEYRIGKHEVSRDMVGKANALGKLGITLFDMTDFGGNGLNRPATGISWNEAARFVNWLNTSQGLPPAYKFGAQPGELGYRANANIQLWDSDDTGFDPSNPFRNKLAQYFLPNGDEWYKAAYFDPITARYFDYPTGSNEAPTPVSRGTRAGTAVYRLAGDGPADITQAGGLSPFGVMGLGGNVAEWVETESDLVNNSVSSNRDVRGGPFYGIDGDLAAFFRDSQIGNPTRENLAIGFRIASTPMFVVGDFNNNDRLDVSDIDLLVTGASDPTLDLTRDDTVDQQDRDYWVHDLAGAWYGDANLNGEFNTGDLVHVLGAGKYETYDSAGWSEGDWNGDGVFNTGDLVIALQDGGYEQGPRAEASAVPEPSAFLLTWIAMLLLPAFRRGVPACC